MQIRFLVVAFSVWACGSETRGTRPLADAPPPLVDAPAADAPPPDTPAPQYSGDVIGQAIPAEANLIIVWIVVSGSPDYNYKFGDGSSIGNHYTASLPGALPAEAINASGIAVGFLALLPKTVQIPEGKLDGTIDSMIIGISKNAIVFRTAASQVSGWQSTFPAGELSCGRCIPGATPSSNETLELAPCSELTIDTTDAQACNVF